MTKQNSSSPHGTLMYAYSLASQPASQPDCTFLLSVGGRKTNQTTKKHCSLMPLLATRAAM